jgi:hypothetical protein
MECNSIKDALPVGWFLVKLVCGTSSIAADARKSNTVKTIASSLYSSNDGPVQKLGQQLIAICSGTMSANEMKNISTAVVALEDARQMSPGGRHDNDKVDYRSISILPTVDEITCQISPYLPTEQEMLDNVASNQFSAPMDRQFRLLREDMIAPLREQLNTLQQQKKLRQLICTEVKFEQAYVDPPGMTAVILVSFQLPPTHRLNKLKKWKERKEYWENSKKLLPRDSLVCLLRNNKPVHFGTIAWRIPANLAGEKEKKDKDKKEKSKKKEKKKEETEPSGPYRPVIGILFEGKHLENVISELYINTTPMQMLQTTASIFSYTPVLKCLQSMPSVPFEEELMLWNPAKSSTISPSYRSSSETRDIKDLANNITPTPEEERKNQTLTLTLDKKDYTFATNQRKALAQALSNRVSVIQGPPGTGIMI